MTPAPDARAWPIIARDADVASLLDRLSRLPVRAQLVTGPAGIGKTVLGQQVAERFEERTVISVIALAELSGVPLGAFAPTLVALGLPAKPDTAVSALLALLGRDPQSHLLLVDDAPRLDDLSAAAIYQLVRGFGVPLLATARLGERLPQPLARLMDEGLGQEHVLTGLEADDVDRLLEARFGTRARHADVVRLTSRTEGNPLYLRVLVETAVREGAVTRGAELIEIDDGGTPPGLLGSIAETLSGLPAAQRRMLRLMSLVQPAEVDRMGFAPDEAALIDDLMLKGVLVREAGSRRLRVAHPLVSEAIERDPETAPAVAEAIRRLLATGEEGHRFAAIRLQLDGSAERLDPADLVWAADRAFAIGDVNAAVSLARHALSATEERGLRFRANLVLASARSMSGELDDADAAFAEADAHATESEELALLASRHGEHLAFRRFDVAAAVALAERVQAQVSPSIAGALDAELRLWHGLAGREHERPADFSAAEAHPEVLVRSAMASIMTESMGGRSEAAGAAASVLARVQARLGVLDPMAAAMLGFDVYIDLLSRGAHERAVELAEGRRIDSGDGVGIWTCTVAEHRSYNGRLAEAHRLASLAVDQCRWRDGMGVLPLALAIQADTTAKLGDLSGARRILDSMDPAQRTEPKAVMMIAECEAWLAQADGDREEAALIVERAAGAAAGVGFRLVAAISLGLCIRLGVVDRAAGMLESLCAEVPPEFGLYTALRDLAVAVRDQRADQVPDAAARLTAAGMAPTALDGIALARRMRPSPETRHRLDAVAMLASTGVDAPPLQDRQAPLVSEREREVALAAAGRERSREIADRLGLSVRTVDNQLQSVYRKLGVSSRDELREALIETGLLPAKP